jgi:hypothetical protein
MRRSVYEFRMPRIRFFEADKLIRARPVSQKMAWIPAGIGRKARVEEVDALQIFDLEMAFKARPQLGGGEKMKAECAASAVVELDFTSVVHIVLFQLPYVVHRIDEGSRHAADRADGGYEMP